MEALTHVLAQQRRAAASPRGATAVVSVSAGTGHSSAAAAKGIPSPAPPSLNEDDLAKVRAAVLERDGGSRRSPVSPFLLGTSAATFSPGGTPVVPSSPSTAQQKQQQQSRWGGRSPGVRSADGASAGGAIDQRLFAPVLRAILAGEGDHVLRRSLLCHPFLKATKGGSTSASAVSSRGSSWGGGPSGSKGSGSGAASSPLSSSGGGGGRRKDGKGSKGGKAKKRDRDRASRNQEDVGASGSPSSSKGGGRGGGPERPSPLDVSREMGRLADCAAADGSLQSTLILVKTLLCAVDPGTKAAVLGASGSPRKQSQQQQQQQGGKGGRTATATPVAAARESGGGDSGSALAGSAAEGSSASPAELTLTAAPLKALAESRLSGWADVMELVRREKYRERMVALRGRPSLTVCSGKGEMRGRLEAKGEFAGVVTAVQVRATPSTLPRELVGGGCGAGDVHEVIRCRANGCAPESRRSVRCREQVLLPGCVLARLLSRIRPALRRFETGI